MLLYEVTKLRYRVTLVLPGRKSVPHRRLGSQLATSLGAMSDLDLRYLSPSIYCSSISLKYDK